MKQKPTPSPADSPNLDENHDETRRNGFGTQDRSPDDGDKAGVSRDENHDESRVNGFDPEVARALEGAPE